MIELPGMQAFDILPHFVALIIAFLLALPIGWNREREDRSAGLRTFPLVAVASCGFVQAAESFALHEGEVMTGVLEGLITGVGFIGGGAILKHGTSVLGTATAASLWVTGAIGVAVGLGALDVAVTLAALTDAVVKAKPSGAKGKYVRKISLTSTMGPGLKLDTAEVEGA